MEDLARQQFIEEATILVSDSGPIKNSNYILPTSIISQGNKIFFFRKLFEGDEYYHQLTSLDLTTLNSEVVDGFKLELKDENQIGVHFFQEGQAEEKSKELQIDC